MYPSYRHRYLPAFTPRKIANLVDKNITPVIIATGAIEQHGPHMPVGVDSIMGQAWLDLAIPKLPPEVPALVGPPITIGKSNEHTGFPGTLSIDKSVLRNQLKAIARQLHAWGFRVMAILNTHGGNTSVLAYTLREIQAELDMYAGMLSISKGVDFGISVQEATYGFHAGEVETSWIMEATEALVDMDAARAEYPASIDDIGELRLERAPATYAWVTSDISQSGIIGDATLATAEKGERWLEACSDALAKDIIRLHQWAAQASFA